MTYVVLLRAPSRAFIKVSPVLRARLTSVFACYHRPCYQDKEATATAVKESSDAVGKSVTDSIDTITAGASSRPRLSAT
jgi:hypothetical protein